MIGDWVLRYCLTCLCKKMYCNPAGSRVAVGNRGWLNGFRTLESSGPGAPPARCAATARCRPPPAPHPFPCTGLLSFSTVCFMYLSIWSLSRKCC